MEYQVSDEMGIKEINREIVKRVNEYSDKRLREILQEFGFKMPRRFTKSYANKVRRKLAAIGYRIVEHESFDNDTGIYEYSINFEKTT